MAGYNLIVKAENIDDAKEYVEDWLSIPFDEIDDATSLGYSQVMVSIVTDENLDAGLNEWLRAFKIEGQPIQIGGLVWWKK